MRNKVNGRVEIVTEDGAFDYFDGDCHACTVFPTVFLCPEGNQLLDCGANHRSDYDEIIAKSRKALSPEGLRKFRATQGNPHDAEDDMQTITRNILSIVLAYLYSGREAQAHRALEELWPPSDQQRLWDLILDTREKGVLHQTRNSPAGSP